MSIRTLVIDDEPLARRSVRRFLSVDPEVEVIAECGDGETAVAAIRNRRPDLVFLDVQMPEMDGFQVVSTVGVEKMPVTIFVTAYDRYALRAFDANALDYLLKPFGRERFELSLARAKERVAGKPTLDAMQRIAAMLAQITSQNEYAERLAVTQNEHVVFVKTREIDWIEAEGNYARLHVGVRRHEIRDTMTNLEAKLNPRDFLRIHRSTIVNVNRIKEIHPWFRGHHLVVLKDGQELRMSRYQRDIAERLGFG